MTVRPSFLEDRSEPEARQFVWAYHIRIDNHSSETVQLISRHWRITDSLGNLHEVRGEGVVGEQPVLRPGETYEYASGTPLRTPSGIMVGSYQMVTESGKRLEVAVPAFSLDSPYADAQIH